MGVVVKSGIRLLRDVRINKCTFCDYTFAMVDLLRSWFAARGGSFHPLVVLNSEGRARFRRVVDGP